MTPIVQTGSDGQPGTSEDTLMPVKAKQCLLLNMIVALIFVYILSLNLPTKWVQFTPMFTFSLLLMKSKAPLVGQKN